MQILTPVAVLISAFILARELRHMTQALTDAVNNLKAEVSETLQAVADKLAEIANNTDDQAAADAINEQAKALDDLQKGALAPTVTGGDTQAG